MAKKTTKKQTEKKAVKTKPAVKKIVEKKSAPKLVKSKSTVKKTDEMLPAPSEEKQEVISQYQVKEGDTGSPEVQVALLTKRVEKLVAHLKGNPADNHSRRGLLGIVSKRRRLLNYLEKKDIKRYKGIAAKLGLGK